MIHIISEGNKELNRRLFVIPPGVRKHLKATLAGYNGDKTVDGYKRLNNLLGMETVSYLEMKRIKNFFDHYAGTDKSVEFQLNGGDAMKTWVNNALQTATTSIRDFKRAKKEAGIENAFIRQHTKNRVKTATNAPKIAKTNSGNMQQALQNDTTFQYKENVCRTVCITPQQAYLIKEAQDEIFSLTTLSMLPDYKSRIRYCNQHIGTNCGRGSSRVTYQLTDERVLKLAYNDKGLKQNQAEIKITNQYGSLTPQIFESNPDGLWLVSEYVLPAKRQDFKYCCGVEWQNFEKFVQTCVATRNNNLEKWGDYVFDENTFQSLLQQDSSGFLKSLNEYVADNVDVDDYDLIKLCNYGLTVRSGQPTLVLLDSGLTNEILTNDY